MRNGSIATLTDTNVLIYGVDQGEPEKQRRAIAVLNRLERDGAGAISVQVLNEFFVTAIRKPTPPLSRQDAAALVAIYARTWPVLDLTTETTLEAIRGVRAHQLSFWDALLWATARLHRIPYLLSEDGPTGATIESVRYINPFASDFDLERWLP